MVCCGESCQKGAFLDCTLGKKKKVSSSHDFMPFEVQATFHGLAVLVFRKRNTVAFRVLLSQLLDGGKFPKEIKGWKPKSFGSGCSMGAGSTWLAVLSVLTFSEWTCTWAASKFSFSNASPCLKHVDSALNYSKVIASILLPWLAPFRRAGWGGCPSRHCFIWA